MITFDIQRTALLSIERLSFVTFVFDVVFARGSTSTLVSDTEKKCPKQTFLSYASALHVTDVQYTYVCERAVHLDFDWKTLGIAVYANITKPLLLKTCGTVGLHPI